VEIDRHAVPLATRPDFAKIPHGVPKRFGPVDRPAIERRVVGHAGRLSLVFEALVDEANECGEVRVGDLLGRWLPERCGHGKRMLMESGKLIKAPAKAFPSLRR